MKMDDNDDQMIFGDLGGLKLPDICLTGEEKPRKTSPRKLVPTGNRTRARCVTSAHATTSDACRGSNSLWTRTLDRYTRAGLPDCVVSTMSGSPPETAQDRTQRIHIQSQDRN